VTRLADELAQIAADPGDLQTTRQTRVKLTDDEITPPEPAIISEPWLVGASPHTRQAIIARGYAEL
jgi:hypothetical protein